MTDCNTPGHEEENCYCGAHMENLPPKWNLTEAQKKVKKAYKQARKPIKLKIERFQQSSSEGFKLETPRLNNQKAQIKNTKPRDDWQRQVKTNLQLKQLTTETDFTPQTS